MSEQKLKIRIVIQSPETEEPAPTPTTSETAPKGPGGKRAFAVGLIAVMIAATAALGWRFTQSAKTMDQSAALEQGSAAEDSDAGAATPPATAESTGIPSEPSRPSTAGQDTGFSGDEPAQALGDPVPAVRVPAGDDAESTQAARVETPAQETVTITTETAAVIPEPPLETPTPRMDQTLSETPNADETDLTEQSAAASSTGSLSPAPDTLTEAQDTRASDSGFTDTASDPDTHAATAAPQAVASASPTETGSASTDPSETRADPGSNVAEANVPDLDTTDLGIPELGTPGSDTLNAPPDGTVGEGDVVAAATNPTSGAETESAQDPVPEAPAVDAPPGPSDDPAPALGTDRGRAPEETGPEAQTELAALSEQPIESAVAPVSAPPDGIGEASIVISERVARSILTSAVQDREPVDELLGPITLDPATGRTVFFFTELRDMAGETVTHRWVWNGETVARVEFPIGNIRWRVYSSKILPGNMDGDWQVVVESSDGALLDRFDFSAVRP
jgi:hypothetical protein